MTIEISGVHGDLITIGLYPSGNLKLSLEDCVALDPPTAQKLSDVLAHYVNHGTLPIELTRENLRAWVDKLYVDTPRESYYDGMNDLLDRLKKDFCL